METTALKRTPPSRSTTTIWERRRSRGITGKRLRAWSRIRESRRLTATTIIRSRATPANTALIPRTARNAHGMSSGAAGTPGPQAWQLPNELHRRAQKTMAVPEVSENHGQAVASLVANSGEPGPTATIIRSHATNTSPPIAAAFQSPRLASSALRYAGARQLVPVQSRDRRFCKFSFQIELASLDRRCLHRSTREPCGKRPTGGSANHGSCPYPETRLVIFRAIRSTRMPSTTI